MGFSKHFLYFCRKTKLPNDNTHLKLTCHLKIQKKIDYRRFSSRLFKCYFRDIREI